MRHDINTYIETIIADNKKHISDSDMTVAEYIIENADNNDTRYCEFFDESELDDTFEPSDAQVEEFKNWLYNNYNVKGHFACGFDPLNPSVEDLYMAVVNLGADASIIENDEDAENLATLIEGATIKREIERGTDEWQDACDKLDFTYPLLPLHVYSFVNGNEFLVCYSKHYGD